MATKKWTDEEEEFLKTRFMEVSNADLAIKFDITKNAVQKKLARMGLKRSQTAEDLPEDEIEEVDEEEEEELESISTDSHFFQGNRLFHEEQDYKQAIEEYRQALAEESSESIKLKALYWMAESHVKIGKMEEAMDILQKLAKQYESSYLGDSAKRRAMVIAEYMNTPSGHI